ncbi:MAG TPA: DUF6371 domain-containing protein [Prolixibacteraceae bacterium]|nr:DUF6371 domain-containing protein [Prolixibacteraceae bacterium]
MSEHRYILQPYDGKDTRYECPACNHPRNTFVRYIDTLTNEHIDDNVGKCDRKSKCNYHYPPKQYFVDNDIPFDAECYMMKFDELEDYSQRSYKATIKNKIEYIPKSQCFDISGNSCYVSDWWLKSSSFDYLGNDHKLFSQIGLPVPVSKHEKCITQPIKATSFIEPDLFKSSHRKYEANNFVSYLISLFGNEITSQLIGKYFIGTSHLWEGATVFWEIDTLGRVRTGKIMLYNPLTGKRVKEPYSHVNWVHKVIKQPEFELKQCLFGEHLLNEKAKPIAIVESEKTAVIASVYLPQFIWLAVGGLEGLTAEKCQVLSGRKVVLFPDLNGYEKWSKKADELSYMAKFTVSDLLEREANDVERHQGLDLADYLIRYDYREFSSAVGEGSDISDKALVEVQIATCEQPVKPIMKIDPMEGYQTFGDLFDLLNAPEYKSLLKRIEIQIPGW